MILDYAVVDQRDTMLNAGRIIAPYGGQFHLQPEKRDLATPLPLLTICWMLGVPSEDAEFLYELAATLAGTSNPPH